LVIYKDYTDMHGQQTLKLPRNNTVQNFQLMYICNYLVFPNISEARCAALSWQLKLSVSEVTSSRF